jgi:hypothetical protein
MRSARRKATAYNGRTYQRFDLADFAGSIRIISARYAEAGIGASTMPYNRSGAVLRREIYRFGHAYREADMIAELREYVEYQHGNERAANASDGFVWVIRLIRGDVAFGRISKSEWSKTAAVLAIAEQLAIHEDYLEHFISVCGGLERLRSHIDTERPPSWVYGITRAAQEAAVTIRGTGRA